MPGTVAAPQLASPARPVADHAEWVAEEKYDGHRLLVRVGDASSRTLFDDVGVRAWSRDGKDRLLPPRVRQNLLNLPRGLYDGELLVPGERSYGVTVLENVDLLSYVVFDVLEILERSLVAPEFGGVGATRDERRAMLEQLGLPEDDKSWRAPVLLAWNWPITCAEDVERLTAEVWSRDGEGLILKRRSSLYRPGKRSKDWMKIKKLQSAVGTVIGFCAGTMGQHSVVVLRDDDGCETSVKWKNLDELAAIEADPKSHVGRRLRFEYQERTPDGGYRHPRWDRWENE